MTQPMGPYALIVGVDDVMDFGWIHCNHQSYREAFNHKTQLEALIEGARMMRDNGIDYAWNEAELPLGSWRELRPVNVKSIEIWAKCNDIYHEHPRHDDRYRPHQGTDRAG